MSIQYALVADSSADLRAVDLPSDDIVKFITVPLFAVGPDGRTLEDTDTADPQRFVDCVRQAKGSWGTSSPSPATFCAAFEQGDACIAITLSSRLSSTYSCACLAADMVREQYPQKKIHVVDTLLTSAGSALVVLKANEWIRSQKYTFEQLVQKIEAYKKTIRIYFVISSFDTFISTGRIKSVTAFLASKLHIHPICSDDGDGNVRIYRKVRGSMGTVIGRLMDTIADYGNTRGKTLVISHCNNAGAAQALQREAKRLYEFAEIVVLSMRGITAFFAGDEGVTISF